MDRNIGLDRTATGVQASCELVSRRAFMARTTLSKLIRTTRLSTARAAGPASAALLDVVVTTPILSEVDMASQ